MPTNDAPRRYDRVIVGAGTSGLAHAWWSHALGESVLVLEATDRVGGVIETLEHGGYRHERAATSVPSSASNLLALVHALPEPPAFVPAAPGTNRQYLLRRRGLVEVPRSPPAFVRSPLLPAGSKVRALLELARGPRQGDGGESLHQFVRRRFGLGVAEAFLRPFTNGIYGAAPERLGAADAFPRLKAMERRRGSVLKALITERTGTKREVLLPRDGMASLPRGVADALGDAVRLSHPVTRVEPRADGGDASVVLRGGGRIEAGEVALATRAYVQAELLAEGFPLEAQRLAAVDYVPIVVVAVGFARDRGPRVPPGFGFLRGHDARVRILGATFNAQLNPAVAPPGCELVTAFAGGSEDREVLALSDDEIGALVLGDLEHALGGTIRPDLVHVWRWTRAIPLFTPGHRGRMAASNAVLGETGIRLLGSHVTGVSLDDCCAPLAPPGALPAGLVRA